MLALVCLDIPDEVLKSLHEAFPIGLDSALQSIGVGCQEVGRGEQIYNLLRKELHPTFVQVRETVDITDRFLDLTRHANIHFIRQGEALGLGHAIGMAEAHVGDEPFAVLLGDDIMRERAGVLEGMVDAYNRHGTSVVALMEVDPADISAYGCAATEPHDEERLFTVTGLVEKPPVEQAPSNLAVMGRYLFTPAIFDEIRTTGPGVGGEIQITDAMVSLLDHETMLGYTFKEGRFDTGKKIDYLRAVVELTLERDDIGPAFREIIADVCRREGLA